MKLLSKPVPLTFMPLLCDLHTCLYVRQSFLLQHGEVGKDNELIDVRQWQGLALFLQIILDLFSELVPTPNLFVWVFDICIKLLLPGLCVILVQWQLLAFCFNSFKVSIIGWNFIDWGGPVIPLDTWWVWCLSNMGDGCGNGTIGTGGFIITGIMIVVIGRLNGWQGLFGWALCVVMWCILEWCLYCWFHRCGKVSRSEIEDIMLGYAIGFTHDIWSFWICYWSSFFMQFINKMQMDLKISN